MPPGREYLEPISFKSFSRAVFVTFDNSFVSLYCLQIAINQSDIDEEKLSMYKYGEPEIAPDNYLSANSLEAYSAPKTFISNSNSNKNNTFRALQSVDCPSYRVIELAIAYDTSFCSFFGGKAAADRKVQTIISGVSDMYKQKGLCMMVVMSHLEGYCDPAVDPYREMLEANNANACSVLYPLQQFWADERADVQKDAVHLFHGYNLPTNTIGCAFVSVLCGDYALAVNEISYTTNQGLQNILVAHELGHNGEKAMFGLHPLALMKTKPFHFIVANFGLVFKLHYESWC